MSTLSKSEKAADATVVTELQKISPFQLADGAKIEEGERVYHIRGVPLILNEGYELDFDRKEGTVAFMQQGTGTGGRFNCGCSASGTCHVRVIPRGGQTVIKCLHSTCSGNCEMSVVLDPKLTLAF